MSFYDGSGKARLGRTAAVGEQTDADVERALARLSRHGKTGKWPILRRLFHRPPKNICCR